MLVGIKFALLIVCVSPAWGDAELPVEEVRAILRDRDRTDEERAAAIHDLDPHGIEAFRVVLTQDMHWSARVAGLLDYPDAASDLVALVEKSKEPGVSSSVGLIALETLRQVGRSEVAPHIAEVMGSDEYQPNAWLEAARTLLALDAEGYRDEVLDFLEALWRGEVMRRVSKDEKGLPQPQYRLEAIQITRKWGDETHKEKALDFLFKMWEDPGDFGFTKYRLNELYYVMWDLRDPSVQDEVVERWMERGLDYVAAQAFGGIVNGPEPRYVSLLHQTSGPDPRFIPLLRQTLSEGYGTDDAMTRGICFEVILEHYDMEKIGDKEWMLESFDAWNVSGYYWREPEDGEQFREQIIAAYE